MPSQSRASQLLSRLLADGWPPERLAEELVVSVEALEVLATGRASMSAERQLCLALFAIQHSEPHRRDGWALRGQVTAAVNFQRRSAGDLPDESASAAHAIPDSKRTSCVEAIRRARGVLALDLDVSDDDAMQDVRSEVQRYTQILKGQGRSAESVVIDIKRLCADALQGDVEHRTASQRVVTWAIDAYYARA